MTKFINWQSVDRGGPKPAKVPFDPATGLPIDPLDKRHWKTYDAAAATGYPVGWVFTDDDPYFFLDLDGCRDPVTGALDSDAQETLAMFPGAAVEVSISGTGLHLIGRCDKLITANLRNKWNGNREFYTRDRFMALGQGFTGSFDTDWTQQILDYVPVRTDQALTGLPDQGPVPEWDGDLDDVALVNHALDSRGGPGPLLGTKASFKALWSGDAATLQRFFPSPTDAFDRSAADGALIMLLGFWTGRDVARVERLWRNSPLALSRPDGGKKMRRAAYVSRSLVTGLRKVTKVYRRKSAGEPATPPGAGLPDVPAGLPGVDVAAMPPVAMPDLPTVENVALPSGQTGGYLTVGDQVEYFKGCVYIQNDHKTLCPDGSLLDEKRFNVIYGGKEFQITPDGSKPTKKAWECFTESRVVSYPKVKGRRYIVGKAFGEIVGDAVNALRFMPGERVQGDASPFLGLVHRLLPNDDDRAIFLTWCAAMVQNPGRKFQWACALQGCEGNGKTFILRALQHAVGISMTHLPNSEDMGEKYNGYMEGKLLIGVEEIHMKGRRDLLDRLKPAITNDWIEIRLMGVDKYMTDNLTNWLFLTNYKDAVIKSQNDRRIAVFFTAQQEASDLVRDGMDGKYFPDLWKWANNGGWSYIAHFLSQMVLDDRFNPVGDCQRAPATSALNAAIEASRGPVEQLLLEAIEQEQPGFRGGWVSSVKARMLLDAAKRQISNFGLADAIKALGYRECETYVKGRAPNIVMQENGQKPKLYCNETVGDRTFRGFLKSQGYEAPQLTIVKSATDTTL